MDERTEQGRRFLMGYRDDDTTEFVSDQEKKLPQPPLCKAPMGGERTVLPRDFSALPEGGGLYDLLTRRRSARIYTEGELSLLQLSFLLWATQGVRAIRLREIMKINAVPALVIGIGLALILFATGGTDNPLNYVVLVVSILCMSLFFSIHYLTIYYLLQPYNAGTELKSGTYRIVLSVTYVVCFALMRLRMPIMIFGIMTIVFCVLYSIVASILVYRLAPKTFRLRT